MRFGVFTDLHYDAIHDGDRRVEELLRSFAANHIDFAIELGDFIHAREGNERIVERFRELPCFFSIGNHNIDACSNETALRFLGLERGHYSVLRENVKFIFLDANYVKTSDGYVHDDIAAKSAGEYGPCVPPEQIDWLIEELSDDNLFYIICSHQSLSNDFRMGNYSRGIVNREEIQAILEHRNSDGRRILFCMNGHDHGDGIRVINGIPYYSLNSASYVWQPNPICRYSEEMHERFPSLKNYIVYEEALHIIVDIDEAMNVTITGMEGSYQEVTPGDVGMGYIWNNVSIEPRTSSIYIPRE